MILPIFKGITGAIVGFILGFFPNNPSYPKGTEIAKKTFGYLRKYTQYKKGTVQNPLENITTKENL